MGLIAPAGTSRVMLEWRWCFLPDLGESSQPLTKCVSCGSPRWSFGLRSPPKYWCLSVSELNVCWLWFMHLLTWLWLLPFHRVTSVDFQRLNQPCIAGVNVHPFFFIAGTGLLLFHEEFPVPVPARRLVCYFLVVALWTVAGKVLVSEWAGKVSFLLFFLEVCPDSVWFLKSVWHFCRLSRLAWLSLECFRLIIHFGKWSRELDPGFLVLNRVLLICVFLWICR